MTITQAARLASKISGKIVSDAKMRRLCVSGDIASTKIIDRYDVDEGSVRAYFSQKK